MPQKTAGPAQPKNTNPLLHKNSLVSNTPRSHAHQTGHATTPHQGNATTPTHPTPARRRQAQNNKNKRGQTHTGDTTTDTHTPHPQQNTHTTNLKETPTQPTN